MGALVDGAARGMRARVAADGAARGRRTRRHLCSSSGVERARWRRVLRPPGEVPPPVERLMGGRCAPSQPREELMGGGRGRAQVGRKRGFDTRKGGSWEGEEEGH